MIRLYSYKNNYGDELSPYIISKLSGEKVVFRKPFSFRRCFFDLLRFIKKIILNGKFDTSFLMYSPFKKVIISIGSILEESTKNSVVWGAGLGSRNIKIKGGVFLAVRGPLSQKRLSELGYFVPEAIGDPALLLPIIYPASSATIKKRFKIGIIPHNIDFEDVNNAISNLMHKDILIISLQTTDVEKVTRDIISCDFILSSSLHGLIVSHAYNIPALHFLKNTLSGDGCKFEDYFLSMGILKYKPLNLSKIDFKNLIELEGLFESLKEHSLPNTNLVEIQNNLLNSAPFKIDESFEL